MLLLANHINYVASYIFTGYFLLGNIYIKYTFKLLGFDILYDYFCKDL